MGLLAATWWKHLCNPGIRSAFSFDTTAETTVATLIDFQPCGGTHVANTAEIGQIIVTKIEKKSAMTRRVVLGFAP